MHDGLTARTTLNHLPQKAPPAYVGRTHPPFCCANERTKVCGAWVERQYMAGGDLCTALQRDMLQSERGGKRRLGWYGRGCNILVGVARGLAYLHEQRVRAG